MQPFDEALPRLLSPLSQINKLLGMYEQRSGQSVQSPGFNMNSLAQFATEQTGQSMPTEVIEQLVKWKVSHMHCVAERTSSLASLPLCHSLRGMTFSWILRCLQVQQMI